MSITAWERMARTIIEDPDFSGLSDEQIEAIIDVLALTIHADRSVSPVEVAGFNHLFFDLPWLEGRHDVVRDHVPRAAKRAVSAGTDPEAARAIAQEAASRLGSGSLRDKVFLMAAGLASVDMKVKAEESEALRAVAEAFGLDQARRAELLAQVESD